MCRCPDEVEEKDFVIVGGGIGGLTLALALHSHCGVISDVYEQAPEFGEGVGGAIGMYPNGLRVLKDINPVLLQDVRDKGYPYLFRRWYRHDGTEVAVANENLLTPSKSDDDELNPIGIRRWKLQNALYDAAVKAGIRVHFGMRVESVDVVTQGIGGQLLHEITFVGENKTKIAAKYLFGADGVKSKVRQAVLSETGDVQEPEYTGVSCLMGASSTPRPVRGICFPSSVTTKCHMCTYPTSEDESIFQIYFPTPTENTDNWGVLNGEEGQKELDKLAKRLSTDGWHEQFVKPIRTAIPGSVVRVGIRAREPVNKWVKDRMVLLGDAAHPPVPYIGQGAMMAIEDAGTIALLLKHYCFSNNFANDYDKSVVDYKRFDEAMAVYQLIRLPRTRLVLGNSKQLGTTQQKRADNPVYNLMREWSIKLQVMSTGTLPIMLPGATFQYSDAVTQVCKLEDDVKEQPRSKLQLFCN